MFERKVQFLVTIIYSSDVALDICTSHAKENLQNAIENERQNNTLTPNNISADYVSTEIFYKSKN